MFFIQKYYIKIISKKLYSDIFPKIFSIRLLNILVKAFSLPLKKLGTLVLLRSIFTTYIVKFPCLPFIILILYGILPINLCYHQADFI